MAAGALPRPLGELYGLVLEGEGEALRLARAGRREDAGELLAWLERYAELPHRALARRARQSCRLITDVLGRRGFCREIAHAL